MGKNFVRQAKTYGDKTQVEMAWLWEELDVAQKVIADLHQQNQALRQKVLTPEKCDRFLNESFRVTEFPWLAVNSKDTSKNLVKMLHPLHQGGFRRTQY